MAALDAELNYIRTRLDEVPFGVPFIGSSGFFNSVGGILGLGFRGSSNFGGRSLGSFGGGRSFHGQTTHRPNVYLAPNYGHR